MRLVIDASVTLAWYFEDERTDSVLAVLNELAGGGAIVPALWYPEVANGFLMALRRKRITADYRAASLKDLSRFIIVADGETNQRAWNESLQLADKHRLTLYDACYLELALRRALPLATLDADLRGAAQTEKVTLLGI